MVKAECAWGDGPDVLIVGKREDGKGDSNSVADVNEGGLGYGHRVLLMEPVGDFDKFRDGMCGHWQLDLTANEALSLAVGLIDAANEALNLDTAFAEAMNRQED